MANAVGDLGEDRHQVGTPPSPVRIGLRWELAELEQLIDGVARGLSLALLASCHQRSKEAISAATNRLLPSERRPASRTKALSAFVLYLSEQSELDIRLLATGYFSRTEKLIPAVRLSLNRQAAAIDPIPTRLISEPSGVNVEDAFNLVAEAVQWVKDDRDREVLYRRLGIIGQAQTFAEIGILMNVTGERVRQLQHRALCSLADHADTDGSPGNALRTLFAGESPRAIVEKLLDIAEYFETTIVVSSLFVLRTSGFSRQHTAAIVELASVTLQARIDAELAARAAENQLRRDAEAAHRVESKISSWLAQADWPLSAKRPPTREQLRTRRSVGDSDTAGTFWSTKLARAVSYESKIEHEILIILDRSEQVIYYQEQPFEIQYEFDESPRRYFPDIFVVTTDGRGLLIEVKPMPHMAHSINRAKATAGRRWANQHGWGWITLDARATFADLLSHVVPAEARSHIDEELRAKGVLIWPEVDAICDQHGLSTMDLTAYIVQTDARLTLKPRYELRRRPDGTTV